MEEEDLAEERHESAVGTRTGQAGPETRLASSRSRRGRTRQYSIETEPLAGCEFSLLGNFMKKRHSCVLLLGSFRRSNVLLQEWFYAALDFQG